MQNIFAYIYIFKLKCVRRGVLCVFTSTYVEMYEGKIHRNIHVHSLVNLNVHMSTVAKVVTRSKQQNMLQRKNDA